MGKIDWKMFKNYYENYFPEATVLIEVNGMEKIRKSLDLSHMRNLQHWRTVPPHTIGSSLRFSLDTHNHPGTLRQKK